MRTEASRHEWGCSEFASADSLMNFFAFQAKLYAETVVASQYTGSQMGNVFRFSLECIPHILMSGYARHS